MTDLDSWGAISVLPTLGASDLETASSYYRKLGFREEWRYPEKESTTHIGLSFGDASLMLTHCADSHIERQNLYFVVNDLDAYNTYLKGVLPAVSAPIDSDYGMRDFSIVDTWGHLLTFGEATGE